METRLIPGLPDCVARHCLLHLPFHAIPVARAVCKRWNHELASPSFYRLRKATGIAHSIVSLLFWGKLSHTVGKLYLALYEPATDVCMIRQLAANGTGNLNGCNNSAIIGRELLVIGGWDVLKDCYIGNVHVYDLVSGAWRTGAPMPAPERTFCKFGLQEGKVFVVGGIDAPEGKMLRSAMVYDVAIDTWLEVPDLEHNTCQGSLCDKFWHSKGEYNRAIQWCKELLLLDDKKYDLRFNVTIIDEKEILAVVFYDMASIEKMEKKEVTLSTHFLETLQRQLGVLPNEIHRHLESFYMCDL